MSVGSEIKRRREALGLSLRDLVHKLAGNVSRRHIARYENNDFFSSTDKLEILLKALFPAKKAEELLKKVVKYVAKNKQEIHSRRDLRKAVTLASNKCISNIQVVYNTMHNFSLPSHPKAKITTELMKGDFGLHMEIKFRDSKKGELYLIFLNEKRIEFYDYGFPNLSANKPQVYEGKLAGKKIQEFSMRYFRHPDALFSCIRKRLNEHELFTFFARNYFEGVKGEKSIILRKRDLELITQGLQSVYKKRKSEQKMALESTIKFVKSLEGRPDKILALRDDLLRVISSIS